MKIFKGIFTKKKRRRGGDVVKPERGLTPRSIILFTPFFYGHNQHG